MCLTVNSPAAAQSSVTAQRAVLARAKEALLGYAATPCRKTTKDHDGRPGLPYMSCIGRDVIEISCTGVKCGGPLHGVPRCGRHDDAGGRKPCGTRYQRIAEQSKKTHLKAKSDIVFG